MKKAARRNRARIVQCICRQSPGWNLRLKVAHMRRNEKLLRIAALLLVDFGQPYATKQSP